MAITVQIPSGKQITVDTAVAVVGRDGGCEIALANEGRLQPRHATIKKVAGKWMIESEGSWLIRVGNGSAGSKCWLNANDVIFLTESGPTLIFMPSEAGPKSVAKSAESVLPPETPAPLRVAKQIADKARAAATSPEAKALGAGVATATAAGTEQFRQGASHASEFVSEQVERLRTSFASAVAGTLRAAANAFGTIIRRPLVLTFYAVVFLITSWLSFAGIITAIFFPMFVMGYLAIMADCLDRKPVSMAAFIGFMRHGWNTLWHLFMMLASFIVIMSIALAPLILFMSVLYLVGGTASSAYTLVTGFSVFGSESVPPAVDALAARQFLREVQAEITNNTNRQRISVWLQEIDSKMGEMREEEEKRQRELAKKQREQADDLLAAEAKKEEEHQQKDIALAESGYNAWKRGAFVPWAKHQSASGQGILSSLWSTMKAFVGWVILLVLFALALFPVCLVALVFFSLILRISRADPTASAGFNLVYDALSETLSVARQDWKEMVTNSLFVPSIFVGSLFVQGLLATFLDGVGFITIERWFIICVLPVYWFAFVVYVTVFLALVSLRSQEEAPV